MAESQKRKKIILSLVVGLVSVLAVIALRRQPAAVPLASVAREDLRQTITSNGKVEPIAATVARAEFPAFVDKVMATEGQSVRRGQTILKLDMADVQAQLAQARASLLAARTELKNARAGGAPDELAQIKGGLQQQRVDVENLERTQKVLEQLV